MIETIKRLSVDLDQEKGFAAAKTEEIKKPPGILQEAALPKIILGGIGFA